MPQDDSMRPYVQIAAFCKTVLREANGNLSIIRIVDRHPVMGTTEEMQPTSVSLTLGFEVWEHAGNQYYEHSAR